jgi:hypothetical protein
MRWAKLGDENTKIFYTVATQSYKRNYITSIKDDDGNYITTMITRQPLFGIHTRIGWVFLVILT